MESTDLTPAQARQLGIVAGQYLNHLGRLRDRMQRRGFPPDDPLVRDATEAWNAVHALSVRLHYLGCTSGVGTPERRPAGVVKTEEEGFEPDNCLRHAGEHTGG